MIKVYAALGLAAFLLSSGFYSGYQISQARIAHKQLKTANEVIQDDNQDKVAITNHISEVKTVQRKSERAIIQIKTIDNTKPCPIADVSRMQQQTYSNFPDVFFLGSDIVPSANDVADDKPTTDQ